MIRTPDERWTVRARLFARSCSQGKSSPPSTAPRAIVRGLSWILLLGIVLAWPGSGCCEWQTFNTSSGLAGNEVLSILEDRSGNIWFGTNGYGVSRFDGVSWRTYTTADGLADNYYVSWMLEDRLGNLWFGTSSGVSRFDGVSWRTYTPADGLAGYSVHSMLEDRSGNLWFGTSNGVSRFDGVSWRTYTTADGLASDYVNSMLEDRSGNLWFGTQGGGVSRFDGVSWRTYTPADGLASDVVTSMLEDRSGSLWFCANYNGVSRFDGVSWRTYTTADGLAGNQVLSMLEDRSGNLWFGAYAGGVSRFDGVSWRTYSTTDGLVSNFVYSMLEDRSGNLWFGTYGDGVSRFDRVSWRTYTTTDSLASDIVTSMLQDRSGNFWFGTSNGVSRFDGASWKTYTTADGLPANDVRTMLEDRSGNLWFGTSNGVSRSDGVSWRTYTTADGLASYDVLSMVEDHSGNLWFGTAGGVSRFDGVSWRTYTTADGLAGYSVHSMFEDRSGNLWFGASYGLSRFDGVSWRTYTTADGLANTYVNSMLEDRSGNLWSGSNYNGVSRFDGVRWRTYTAADGLAGDQVLSMLEDRSGNLWFGTNGYGVSRYEPDRVPPKTAFLNVPASVSSVRNLSATFIAAFGGAKGVEFSYKFDGGSWSAWAPVGAWIESGLADGSHVLEARSRDYAGNVDSFPALTAFVVDATPPAPSLSSPTFGQAVQGATAIRGTTADARFLVDSVWVRPAGANSWVPPAATLLAHSSAQVTDGTLAGWDTSNLPDGSYDLRLSVMDSLGLTGTALVSVLADNHFPFVDETAPARVTAASGGNLYTTNQELHLYFPPHAFDQDALVSIAAAGSPPDTLPSGAIRVLPGYDISWSAASLRKPATLAFSTAGRTPVPGTLAVYFSSNGSAWQRLGGTPTEGKLSLAVQAPGRYALFAETGVISGDGTLAGLAFTPRVFSPTGGFANTDVGISFTLGRPAPVTVRVYSRSGRLIREVATGQPMNAGANLVRWDGRDRNGGFAADGLYLVTVEALGRTERKTLAVVK